MPIPIDVRPHHGGAKTRQSATARRPIEALEGRGGRSRMKRDATDAQRRPRDVARSQDGEVAHPIPIRIPDEANTSAKEIRSPRGSGKLGQDHPLAPQHGNSKDKDRNAPAPRCSKNHVEFQQESD